jgi:DNA-binding transcriptional regulator YhcF (GntR family)
MDEDLSSLWDQIVIDRRESTSPFRQIANSVRHKIATNQLAANTPLPSVRSLAEQVGVTPATVARAYRQLQSDGLVESLQGKGTVVSDTERLVFHAKNRSHEALDEAIDEAVRPLLAMGFTPAEIGDAVARRLAVPTAPQHALVVSDSPAVLDKYTEILGRELAPLGVQVNSMSFEDLTSCKKAARKMLGECARVMTALGLLRPVQQALEDCGANVPVSVIFTEIKLETIERLSSIPKDTQVLIVAEKRYRNSVLGILREYLPADNIHVARSLDPESIRQDLKERSIVVHSLGARDVVLAEITDHHKTILMDYQPRRDALAKLRESFSPSQSESANTHLPRDRMPRS